MRWSNAVIRFRTIASIRALSAGGKYLRTYIWPTASPSALPVASTARFQRSRRFGVPWSAVAWKSKLSWPNAAGITAEWCSSAWKVR
jgi:hypothetical protein